MLRLKHVLLASLFAAMLPAFANAADISAVSATPSAYEVKKVAVVDIKKVMDESIASKDAQDEINSIKDKYYKEIEAADKQLQTRRKELTEQKSAMSADAFAKKVNEFENKVQSERKEAARKQKVVESAFMKSLELIRDETLKVVYEVAEEKNLDMVVPTSQLLYSKKGIDITDEVIVKLNARLTKVNINIKAEDMPADKSDSDSASDSAPAKSDSKKATAKPKAVAKADKPATPAPAVPTTPPASQAATPAATTAPAAPATDSSKQ